MLNIVIGVTMNSQIKMSLLAFISRQKLGYPYLQHVQPCSTGQPAFILCQDNATGDVQRSFYCTGVLLSP